MVPILFFFLIIYIHKKFEEEEKTWHHYKPASRTIWDSLKLFWAKCTKKILNHNFFSSCFCSVLLGQVSLSQGSEGPVEAAIPALTPYQSI